MAEKQNTPEIRFEGFTDPWEQRKLGELGLAQSGIGFPDTEQGGAEGTPFFKVSDMNMPGNEHELVASNNYVTPEQIARMGWHPINQVPAIFFAKVGAAVMLNRKRLINKPFLLDNNTMAFSMDSSLLNAQFGQSLFERIDLTSLIQIGALPSYNSSDVESITVSLPSTMDEQCRIGQCLCNMNDLITLHQRKHDKLCTVKRSMLDKMFPKPGETEPEIRFKGFTDPWEQRKLGDCVGSTYGGGTPSTSHDEYWGGDIPWIQSSNVLENELFRIDIPKAITQDGLSKSAALQVPEDSIAVVTHVGVGKLVYLPFSYATSQDFVSLSELKGDANFLCYAIHRKLQSELHMVQGSAIKGITKEELLGKAISLPAAEEQKLVGNQMRAIDNLITLHQREPRFADTG